MRRGLIAILLLFAAACGDSSGPSADNVIEVADDLFNPSEARVGVGETVTWRWVGNNSHNVTFVGNATPSPTQSSGTYQRSFPEPGPYQYYCSIHGTASSGMRGVLVVE